MHYNNKIIFAAAGSGKTSELVNTVSELINKRVLLTTYTLENTNEIRNKFYNKSGTLPTNVTIKSWFSFLLTECVRPYQNFLYSEHRIDNIEFVSSQSTRGISKNDIKRYYLKFGNKIYTDKISDFILRINELSMGKLINRLESIFDVIMIDEVQDLAGYDLNFLKLLFHSKIQIIVVGDSRQSTFFTNNSTKNKNKRGIYLPTYFKEWENQGLCTVTYRTECHRSNQIICDLADSLYPEMPKTSSLNNLITDHDGVFFIRSSQVQTYIEKYSPQILRYNRITKIPEESFALNFGKSKGLTFNRTLIICNGPLNKFLKTGDIEHLYKSRPSYYVGITRAKYSVCFVCDEKNINYENIEEYIF